MMAGISAAATLVLNVLVELCTKLLALAFFAFVGVAAIITLIVTLIIYMVR